LAGVKTQTNPNGNVIVTNIDGTKTQTNIDGTVHEKLADGTQVTRLAEGAAAPQQAAEPAIGGPGVVPMQPEPEAMAAMTLEGAPSNAAAAAEGGGGSSTAEETPVVASSAPPAADPALDDLLQVEEPLQRMEPIKIALNDQPPDVKSRQLNMLSGANLPTTMMGNNDPSIPDLDHSNQNFQNPQVVHDKDQVKSMQRTPDGGANTEFTDGVKTREFGDGTVVQDFPDGTKLIMNNRVKRTMKPNGYTIDRYTDGRTVESHPDGTVLEVMPNGLRVQTNPDGTNEQIELDGTKTQVMADGTIKVTKGNVIRKDMPQFRY